jgi:hypothetical protein
MGILEDIILFYYGPISILIIVFKCNWVKNEVDRWGNPTYKRDQDGFLLANFRVFKVKDEEPYVFLA